MSDTVIEIEIGNTFYQYVDAAIVRMMALQPEVQLTFEQPKVSIVCPNDEDPNQIRSDFLDLLYREKIYQDTLPIRKTIMGV